MAMDVFHFDKRVSKTINGNTRFRFSQEVRHGQEPTENSKRGRRPGTKHGFLIVKT